MKLKPSSTMRCIDVVVTMVTLMIFVQCASSASVLRKNHPMREVIDKVNENGPYIGLVMADSNEENALQTSGFFTPSPYVPPVDLSGRTFNIGTVKGVNVIYVKSGERRLNAGMTIQMLIDAFDIQGIVHYGTAGSANNSLSFGGVSIPKYLAFTGAWTWMEFNATGSNAVELDVGNYNVPHAGENFLGNIEFKTEEFYSVGNPMQYVFWLEPDPTWYNLAATKLAGMELQKCVNETYCLPETPIVVPGLRASTADMFVDNAAYRKFLSKQFKVSTVDEESSAMVQASMSTGVPCIVFRGISDLAGGGSSLSQTKLGQMKLSHLAAVNSLYVAVKFIELLGEQDLIRTL